MHIVLPLDQSSQVIMMSEMLSMFMSTVLFLLKRFDLVSKGDNLFV